MTILPALLLMAALCIFVPMAVWSVECLAAMLPARRRNPASGVRRPTVAVLVPAHNEAAVIRETLARLAPQILPGDRLVVIADNCTDGTAAIARRAGAAVLERHDLAHRGKSYALSYAVRSLEQDPPDVVIVIDADCTAHAGAVDAMARLAFAAGRPVQASYLLELPAKPQPAQSISVMAFQIANLVRPSGLDRLGLPCFLNGSGMAFPTATIQGPVLASGTIAEDKWLTVDLMLAGNAPLFCAEAKVTSRLPGQKRAQASQSVRWLHGHLQCIFAQGPRLLLGAVRQRRGELFAALLHLLVPPLSLMALLWIAILTASLAAGLLGIGWLPSIAATAGGALALISFGAVLLKFGEKGLFRALWSIPFYVVSRLPIFAAFFVRPQRDWVRTGRDPVPPPE